MTSPSVSQPAGPPAGRLGRLVSVVRDRTPGLAMLLTGSAMSRGDKAAWRSARTMGDLGELVIAWLRGEIVQTPGTAGLPTRRLTR